MYKETTDMKILIIDNNHGIPEILEQIMKRLGHEAISAETGRQGIDQFRADSDIDLVTMNGRLTDPDSDKVHDKIRDINPDIPILLISGSVPEEEMAKRIQVSGGKTNSITKPVCRISLRAAIEQFAAAAQNG